MELFQGPGACLVVEPIIREGFMMQARKRASLVFLSWNGTVNALCPKPVHHSYFMTGITISNRLGLAAPQIQVRKRVTDRLNQLRWVL